MSAVVALDSCAIRSAPTLARLVTSPLAPSARASSDRPKNMATMIGAIRANSTAMEPSLRAKRLISRRMASTACAGRVRLVAEGGGGRQQMLVARHIDQEPGQSRRHHRPVIGGAQQHHVAGIAWTVIIRHRQQIAAGV